MRAFRARMHRTADVAASARARATIQTAHGRTRLASPSPEPSPRNRHARRALDARAFVRNNSSDAKESECLCGLRSAQCARMRLTTAIGPASDRGGSHANRGASASRTSEHTARCVQRRAKHGNTNAEGHLFSYCANVIAVAADAISRTNCCRADSARSLRPARPPPSDPHAHTRVCRGRTNQT